MMKCGEFLFPLWFFVFFCFVQKSPFRSYSKTTAPPPPALWGRQLCILKSYSYHLCMSWTLSCLSKQLFDWRHNGRTLSSSSSLINVYYNSSHVKFLPLHMSSLGLTIEQCNQSGCFWPSTTTTTASAAITSAGSWSCCEIHFFSTLLVATLL